MAYSKTKDEQLAIARQSQIKTMMDYQASCGKCLDLKTLVGGANVLATRVVEGYSKEIGERLDLLQKHIDGL